MFLKTMYKKFVKEIKAIKKCSRARIGAHFMFPGLKLIMMANLIAHGNLL